MEEILENAATHLLLCVANPAMPLAALVMLVAALMRGDRPEARSWRACAVLSLLLIPVAYAAGGGVMPSPDTSWLGIEDGRVHLLHGGLQAFSSSLLLATAFVSTAIAFRLGSTRLCLVCAIMVCAACFTLAGLPS